MAALSTVAHPSENKTCLLGHTPREPGRVDLPVGRSAFTPKPSSCDRRCRYGGVHLPSRVPPGEAERSRRRRPAAPLRCRKGLVRVPDALTGRSPAGGPGRRRTRQGGCLAPASIEGHPVTALSRGHSDLTATRSGTACAPPAIVRLHAYCGAVPVPRVWASKEVRHGRSRDHRWAGRDAAGRSLSGRDSAHGTPQWRGDE